MTWFPTIRTFGRRRHGEPWEHHGEDPRRVPRQEVLLDDRVGRVLDDPDRVVRHEILTHRDHVGVTDVDARVHPRAGPLGVAFPHDVQVDPTVARADRKRPVFRVVDVPSFGETVSVDADQENSGETSVLDRQSVDGEALHDARWIGCLRTDRDAIHDRKRESARLADSNASRESPRVDHRGMAASDRDVVLLDADALVVAARPDDDRVTGVCRIDSRLDRGRHHDDPAG